MVILDGGHNIQGVYALIDSLTDVFDVKKFVFVMGVLADKDYEDMVKIVAPYAKKVYAITPPNPRKLDAKDLAKCFVKYGVDAEPVAIDNVLKIAKNHSQVEDVIAAFGSLYSISTLVNIYKSRD